MRSQWKSWNELNNVEIQKTLNKLITIAGTKGGRGGMQRIVVHDVGWCMRYVEILLRRFLFVFDRTGLKGAASTNKLLDTCVNSQTNNNKCILTCIYCLCNNIPVVPARGGAEVALKIYIRPFSSIELACAVHQPSPCVRALCKIFCQIHSSAGKNFCQIHILAYLYAQLHAWVEAA